MHQPFIHMMQRSGDRNSCGYAGGPQPFGDNKTQDVSSYEVNTEIIIPGAPSRDGYEFLGWSGDQKAAGNEMGVWTQEQWDNLAAANKILKETDKHYAADNLDGLAWQDENGRNVLYACWKKKPVTLTIRKEIKGEQADLTKGYTFTVTKADGTSYTTKALYDTNGENGTGDSVTLGGKDKTGIALNWGDKVTITETDNAGYTTTYTATVGTHDAVDGTGKATQEITLDGNATVVFTNKKDNVIVTGIRSAGVPGALTAVGAAALAIAGGFAYVRRDEAGAGAHARRRGRR